MDEKRTTQALKQIFDLCGTGIIKDRRRFEAHLEDLLPSGICASERKLLLHALDSDALPVLLRQPALTEGSARQAVEMLQNDIYVSEEAAQFVVRCVIAARGGEPVAVRPAPTPPQPPLKPMPEPIPQAQAQSKAAPQAALGIPRNQQWISNKAFIGRKDLTNVLIPDNIENIASEAFRDCICLTEVTLPKSLIHIGHQAFRGCTRLTHIVMPNWIINDIAWAAFADCVSLTSINIPKGLTKIRAKMFAGCTNLTKVTIPDSVIEIDSTAFDGCTSLKHLSIPNGCQIVNKGFYMSSTQLGCSGLRITRR